MTSPQRRLLPLIVAVVFSNQPLDTLAGKLNRVRDQARTSSSSSSDSDSSHDSDSSRSSRKRDRHAHAGFQWNNDDSCDDDSISADLYGAAFLAALVGVSSPIWGPRLALGDDGAEGYFPDHPYDDAAGGLLYTKTPSGAHDTLVVLQGQYGDDFGGVSHANGRLLLESSWRIGIDSEFYYRHEDGAPDDELWSGDFNVTWRFAQSEPLQFRAGVGFNWLADRTEEDYGFNFTYGADLFPGDPWILSGTIDWGRLGEATLFHGRTTIGVTQNGFGVFTGYDYFNVGGAGLHAWINGVELRF